MDIHYAIGDVHGRDDLLERLIERIVATHRERHGDARSVIVYIGDYIDRGANSLAVIDRVMRGVHGFETVCLKGNHEELLLACLETGDRELWSAWLGNGGDETMRSLGIPTQFGKYDPGELAGSLGKERIAWLRALRLYYRAGPYLFVHAGILPGRPVEQQQEKDLLWIRRRFLDSDEDHGFCVVHGHTPAPQPELRHNRIGIDTGATINGTLTAVVLGEPEGPRFETIAGAPGRGP
jgi:serine/threonine protein phosphatase 1